MKEDKGKKSFLIQILRRASYKWKPRGETLKRARFARGRYRCAMCLSTHFKVKEIVVDHIEPVVDVSNGWKSWDEYINRMFCELDGFQVLCKPCHQIKSNAENLVRRQKQN